MKRQMPSWFSYLLTGLIVQCFVIIHMIDIRGSFEIGGEFLILPVMILVRCAIWVE